MLATATTNAGRTVALWDKRMNVVIKSHLLTISSIYRRVNLFCPRLWYNKWMQNLLTLEHLDAKGLNHILSLAEQFLTPQGQIIDAPKAYLAGKTVANLFFEPSTRTRSTFELAAKKLGAHVLNLNIQTSSTQKGEALQDTLHTLQAMQCDIFVVRHQQSGATHFIANTFGKTGHVINAGDGAHAHPTQALLDMLTIKKHKGDFKHLSIAIIGDILHSRVARSEIQDPALF